MNISNGILTSFSNLDGLTEHQFAIHYDYDADGLPTVVSDGASAVSNGWDAATGGLVRTRGADGTEVGYRYRNDGAVTSVVSVAGVKALDLDPYGRWTKVESAAGTAVFGYSEWNGLAAVVTNGATVTEYAYDLMDRVTNVAWRTAGGEELGGIAYEYDALGRITARSLALGDDSFDRAYSYDGRDRLASDGGVAYRYDAAGNRLAKVGDAGGDVAYTLGVGDRLAAWTDGAYEYDAAGCVTRIRRGGDVLDLAWDGLYRLVSVSTNGVVAEFYRYDALGRRTVTVNAEGTERHVWDGDHCLADVDEEGNVLRAYLWGPGVDNLLAVRVGGRNYAALTDIQGTVWGYADERGEIVARWTYDAWGNVLSEDVRVPALAAVRYRFQGREFSRATGLTNFRARWYDPTTGRWLSKDPIGLSGGLNLYAFCGNNSLNMRDPMGLCMENVEDGDEVLRKIRLFYDAIETFKYGKRFTQYMALFSLSGGPWGPLDFKFHKKGPFKVKGDIYPGDYFGNYVAGYQAGYADGTSNYGLLAGVYCGGILWSIISTEKPGDSESKPAIDHGYADGVNDRLNR